MEARRRLVGNYQATYHEPEVQYREDSDDEYLYNADIWKVYDESDDDATIEKNKKARLHRLQRRQTLSAFSGMFLVVVALTVLTYAMNIYTHTEAEKLRTHLGHDEGKHHSEIWWHRALVYYIHPRSFQDSDGDGIGDIKGVYVCRCLCNI